MQRLELRPPDVVQSRATVPLPPPWHQHNVGRDLRGQHRKSRPGDRGGATAQGRAPPEGRDDLSLLTHLTTKLEPICASVEAARVRTAAWISGFSRVFEGNATIETDKEALVLPLLGLYGELLSERLVVGAESFSRTPRANVLADIKANKEVFFPREYTIMPGKQVKLDGKHTSVNASQLTRELFGDLIERIEQRVEEDNEKGETLRNRLAQWGEAAARRGSKAHGLLRGNSRKLSIVSPENKIAPAPAPPSRVEM
jgi:hypothetical protein